MMFKIVITLFIVIARDVPQCEAMINILSHGPSPEGVVKSAVDAISQSIKDAGLDPMRTGKLEINCTKPIALNVTIMELTSYGLSNIVVNKVKYAFFASRFDLDIEMPYVNMSLGDTSGSAYILHNAYTMESSVSMELYRLRLVSQVQFSFDISSGITVDNLDIHFSLDDIKPNVKLIMQDVDFSVIVNNLLRPLAGLIKASSAMIDEFLDKFLLNYVNNLLNNII